MKRTMALFLALLMALSLVGCSGGGETGGNDRPNTGSGDVTSTDTPSEAETDFTAVKWVNVYTGGWMELKDDQTVEGLGDNRTWRQEGEELILSYENNGYKFEQHVDILKEDGLTSLRETVTKIDNMGMHNEIILGNEYYPEDQVDAVRTSIALDPGAAVSTDIIELTVHKASLCYYAAGATTSSDGETVNPEEACEPADSDALYSCNKGHALVCLDYTIKNTDRDRLDTGDRIVQFSILQDGNSYPVNGYDLNVPDGNPLGLSLYLVPIARNGGRFRTSQTSNVIIEAEESYEIKAVGVAGFEADLSAPFDLIVSVQNSSGNNENFIYSFG